jgi:hypothetical protein
MSSKLLMVGAAAVVIAFGAYWYWSPFVAVRSMKAAAERKDADAFNEYVEYPRVRESLKGQFSAMMAERMAASSGSGSDAGRVGAALGSAFAMALADKFIDGMVRPEAVMRVMNDAKLADKPSGQAPDKAEGGPPPQRVKWAHDRKSIDKLIAYPEGEDEDKRVSVVFERFGIFHWKLTEVRLPMGAK